MWRRATQIAVIMTTLTVGASVAGDGAGAGSSTVGSSGLGDRFFPLGGNGGYDVLDYDVSGRWEPARSNLVATTHIKAVATQDLTQFDLDLRGFDVQSVEVNDRPVRFSRSGQELTLKLNKALRNRDRFTVDVAYRGQPQPVIDPDGSSEGWLPTSDGITALGEPQGSPGWFPSNDYPTDKATFSVEMTVPKNLTVVSNGLPGRSQRNGPLTTYTWTENKPMATYLATLAIGPFTMSTARTSAGIPVINAIDPALAADSAAAVARIPEMVDWLTTVYGPYPFDSVGAIVVDAPDVGYALETQERPTFTWAPDDLTMVHELAHQWVGDSVSISSWPEMWLNEGFAGYTEWMWTEHDGGQTAQQSFDDAYGSLPADDAFWTQPIGPGTLPDASVLFSNQVYLRGAMTLHALRNLVGDDAFFRILRTWTTSNRYGNVSTAQFVSLAERISHRSLDDFFSTWLDTPAKPAL